MLTCAHGLARRFTIRNDVNLKRATLKLLREAQHPHLYHLEFVFDASLPCTASIHYAATVSSSEHGAVPRLEPLSSATIGAVAPPPSRVHGPAPQGRFLDRRWAQLRAVAP